MQSTTTASIIHFQLEQLAFPNWISIPSDRYISCQCYRYCRLYTDQLGCRYIAGQVGMAVVTVHWESQHIQIRVNCGSSYQQPPCFPSNWEGFCTCRSEQAVIQHAKLISYLTLGKLSTRISEQKSRLWIMTYLECHQLRLPDTAPTPNFDSYHKLNK